MDAAQARLNQPVDPSVFEEVGKAVAKALQSTYNAIVEQDGEAGKSVSFRTLVSEMMDRETERTGKDHLITYVMLTTIEDQLWANKQTITLPDWATFKPLPEGFEVSPKMKTILETAREAADSGKSLFIESRMTPPMDGVGYGKTKFDPPIAFDAAIDFGDVQAPTEPEVQDEPKPEKRDPKNNRGKNYI